MTCSIVFAHALPNPKEVAYNKKKLIIVKTNKLPETWYDEPLHWPVFEHCKRLVQILVHCR